MRVVTATDISDLLEANISGAEIGHELSLRQVANLTEFKHNYLQSRV